MVTLLKLKIYIDVKKEMFHYYGYVAIFQLVMCMCQGPSPSTALVYFLFCIIDKRMRSEVT